MRTAAADKTATSQRLAAADPGVAAGDRLRAAARPRKAEGRSFKGTMCATTTTGLPDVRDRCGAQDAKMGTTASTRMCATSRKHREITA
jgi:hypothetical protein